MKAIAGIDLSVMSDAQHAYAGDYLSAISAEPTFIEQPGRADFPETAFMWKRTEGCFRERATNSPFFLAKF